jgi:hypothetical protein
MDTPGGTHPSESIINIIAKPLSLYCADMSMTAVQDDQPWHSQAQKGISSEDENIMSNRNDILDSKNESSSAPCIAVATKKQPGRGVHVHYKNFCKVRKCINMTKRKGKTRVCRRSKVNLLYTAYFRYIQPTHARSMERNRPRHSNEKDFHLDGRNYLQNKKWCGKV